MKRTSILCASLALLALAAPAPAQESPGPLAERRDVWALEILPLAERFERAADVRLLLTVRNVGDEPRAISLPWRAGASWPQWVAVSRDGLRLEPGVDVDFGAEPATLAPGEQVSVLVPLARFLSPEALAAAGPGRYALRWNGGTIGFAADAEASFELTGAPLAGARPGSLESFLRPARPGEALAERVDGAWSALVTRPSDPRLVAFLAAPPPSLLDPFAAFELFEETDDLGVQRELVRLLGGIGRNAFVAERLIELLTQHRDPSLASLGSESLESLRGE